MALRNRLHGSSFSNSLEWPNLFVIGATKCATTTFHAHLDIHPEISMSIIKEPGYFLDKCERHPSIKSPAGSEGEESKLYRSLFLSSGARYRGESSTGYTHLPKRTGVVDRINKTCKNPKFIYIMRDPIERAVSHYWWNVRHEGERLGLLEAIRKNSTYIDVSNYPMQLRPYLDCFGADSVLPVIFEELAKDYCKVMSEVFRWLNVDLSPVKHIGPRRENKTPSRVIAPRSRFVERFRNSSFWNRVGPNVPSSVRRLARRSNEISFMTYEKHDEQAIEYMRKIQRDQVCELSVLLKRSFPLWENI